MATEILRCSECGTPFKGVPSWLRTAKVTFTCTSCPKRGARSSGARFEPAVELRPTLDLDKDTDTDNDPDLDDVEIDLDDEADLDFSEDDPDLKDEPL